jgi:hypothetical protein
LVRHARTVSRLGAVSYGRRSAHLLRHRDFESEEAAIADLPGEYERFLESPQSADPEEQEYFPAYIAEWRAEGRFVLLWCVDYWLTADGRVLTHG